MTTKPKLTRAQRDVLAAVRGGATLRRLSGLPYVWLIKERLPTQAPLERRVRVATVGPLLEAGHLHAMLTHGTSQNMARDAEYHLGPGGEVEERMSLSGGEPAYECPACAEAAAARALLPTSGPGIDRPPVLLAYGAGRNSTALIVGLDERGERPDAITFADTGGEKPETYLYVEIMDAWLAARGYPVLQEVCEVRPTVDGLAHALWPNLPPELARKVATLYRLAYGTEEVPETLPPKAAELVRFFRTLPARDARRRRIAVVRNDGKYKTLENNCLELGMLPSPAYGGQSCADKYKQRPQHKWAKSWEPCRRWWNLDDNGRMQKQPGAERYGNHFVVKLIGYHAGESRRGADVKGDGFYEYRHPLKDWGWDQQACEDALARAGLLTPPKSSCFYCPHMRKPEIVQLQNEHPELLERALDMERRAVAAGKLKTVPGLGRSSGRYNWGEYLERYRLGLAACSDANDPLERGCICQVEVYEGEAHDADCEEIGEDDPERAKNDSARKYNGYT